MIKTSGKSNIPLYVGFVGSNKVLNTHDETSSLQLRMTNTNLPDTENPNITFNHDTDSAKCSQLVVVLEVGTITDSPWALGTQQQVNDISIDLGEQWEQNGAVEEIAVEGTVKALKWRFIPKEADVVLGPQATLLVDLTQITTAHPTGGANLYLRYQYVEGYRDGQFICQIEKAPLVFDSKVRVGTTKELDGRLTVKDGISLDAPGEIQHVGPLVFRSDVDGTNDSSSVLFYKQNQSNPLMSLQSDGVLDLNQGNLNVNQGDLNFSMRNGQRINLWDTLLGIGVQNATVYFRTTQNFAWYKGGSHKEGELESGNDAIVQMVIKDGDVGIGTASPSAKLDVHGTTVISDNLGIGTTSPSAKLDVQGDLKVTGDYYGKGDIWLHAYEGDGSNGTAYVQARDNSGSGGSNINLQFRTQNNGTHRDALELTSNGKIRINGGPVMKYEKL